MIQIITVFAIMLTVFLVIRNNKERLTIKKMTLTAILLSLSLVLTMFSLNLFFLGGQVVIRFSQLVLILLGASLGPVYAIIAGLGFDVLNLLINPLGAPYIGFSLNNIWVGLFAALIFKYFTNKSRKFKFTLMMSTALAYTLYILVVLVLFISQKDVFEIIDSVTYGGIKKAMLLSLVILILIGSLFLYFNRKKDAKFILPDSLMLLITSAILVEFVVQGFFTPIWLYDLAKTPILLSMQIRAIKGWLMVFLNSFIGYSIYKSVLVKISK